MESYYLVTIEYMLLFRPRKSQDFINIYNGRQTCQTNKFKMAVQKKVEAFIYWVRGIQRSQDAIIYHFWTQPQLVLIVQELEV